MTLPAAPFGHHDKLGVFVVRALSGIPAAWTSNSRDWVYFKQLMAFTMENEISEARQYTNLFYPMRPPQHASLGVLPSSAAARFFFLPDYTRKLEFVWTAAQCDAIATLFVRYRFSFYVMVHENENDLARFDHFVQSLRICAANNFDVSATVVSLNSLLPHSK